MACLLNEDGKGGLFAANGLFMALHSIPGGFTAVCLQWHSAIAGQCHSSTIPHTQSNN